MYFPGFSLDEPVTHGRSEAGATAAGFGGEKRVKDAMDVFAGNAGAGIRHFDFHAAVMRRGADGQHSPAGHGVTRSEEHTSELQSQSNLVCRLLLEKKKNAHIPTEAAFPLKISASSSPPMLSRTALDRSS